MSELEYVLLADHAEAVNGRLNVLGAGWTDQYRGVVLGAGAPISHFGIGVSVLVPWNETNRPHRLGIRIEDEDGANIGGLEADLEMGRPPGIAHGSDQRAVLGVNVNLTFPRPGGYRVVAELAGQTRTLSFRVHDDPPPG
jgi:hypothetical protein